MAGERRDNSGTLGPNHRREEGSNQSEYTGTAVINGVEYWINGWLKTSERGPFYSLSFKRKEARRDGGVSIRPQAPSDSGLPF